MPNNSSFADFVNAWDRLLKAVENNEGDLPDLQTYQVSLEGVVQELRTLGARQDSLKASLRENTKAIQGLLGRGRDHAFHLRTYLKGHLGPRNERLIEYGIRPFRAARRVPPDPILPPPPPIEDVQETEAK